jgi:hypothetical protein
MLSKAVLLMLFAVGASPTPDATTAPSALAVSAAPLRAELALGAWRGTLVDGTGARRALDVAVSDGPRRDTVVGFFTLPTQRGETVVRRLGRVIGDDLVFELREGGRVALRLLSGRLVGDVVDPGGQLTAGGGTLELGRTRP